jgi:hypothetical protein
VGTVQVSVPTSSLFKTVTVRCGHCSSLLTVNMRSLLFQGTPTTNTAAPPAEVASTTTTITTEPPPPPINNNGQFHFHHSLNLNPPHHQSLSLLVRGDTRSLDRVCSKKIPGARASSSDDSDPLTYRMPNN